MAERFRVLRLDEVDGYADEGRPRWHMIRTVLGIESRGINAWRATELGQAIIGEHLAARSGCRRSRGAVLRRVGARDVHGRRRASSSAVGLTRLRRGSGSCDAARSPTRSDTTILVIGGRPGEIFSVSPWERSAEALGFLDDRRMGSRNRRPDRAAGGGTGERERALQPRLRREPRRSHRRRLWSTSPRQWETEPRFAATAQDDPDLVAVRDDDRFPDA